MNARTVPAITFTDQQQQPPRTLDDVLGALVGTHDLILSLLQMPPRLLGAEQCRRLVTAALRGIEGAHADLVVLRYQR